MAAALLLPVKAFSADIAVTDDFLGKWRAHDVMETTVNLTIAAIADDGRMAGTLTAKGKSYYGSSPFSSTLMGLGFTIDFGNGNVYTLKSGGATICGRFDSPFGNSVVVFKRVP